MARPKEFNPDEALGRAMREFWVKGYFDTSIRDLVDCTGVNYYGLYEVFENKHGLYRESLKLYAQEIILPALIQLRDKTPIKARLRKTFQSLLTALASHDRRAGCMICNASIELSSHDPEINDLVLELRQQMTRAFSKALSSEPDHSKTATEITNEARFLTNTAFSVGLMLRSGESDAAISRHIKIALNAIT